MARFYGTKILSGTMTLEDVPKLWKAKTEQWLNQNKTSL
jgi:Zn-dependent M32 family carboxypeptidase